MEGRSGDSSVSRSAVPSSLLNGQSVGGAKLATQEDDCDRGSIG